MVKRILIADDDRNLRLLVTTTLEDPRYEILEATNGDETLAAIRDRHPDLVLLDWMMPERSGIEVLQALQAEPALAAIPVVMLTAKAQAADRQQAIELGAVAYLTKPFSPLELMKMVNTLLEG
jgi:two-component system phosphate regulon response regulator PhoB